MLHAVAARILVIDDEPDLLELVRFNLAEAGYRVETAETGEGGLALARECRPDLMVLDLMLPDVPGTEVCRRVRADPDLGGLPVLMLTAKSEEIDRIVGLELGADDYLTKPFSPRELSLRVAAILRRSSPEPEPEASAALEHGTLRLEPERHRCEVEGQRVELTAKEFKLLHALMSRPGRVLSRERLLELVWGEDITVTTRTIETVRGVGYRFAE